MQLAPSFCQAPPEPTSPPGIEAGRVYSFLTCLNSFTPALSPLSAPLPIFSLLSEAQIFNHGLGKALAVGHVPGDHSHSVIPPFPSAQ